jgi:hypothetical protein
MIVSKILKPLLASGLVSMMFMVAAQAAPITPVQSANLAMWLDATSGLSQSAGTVTWNDLSGNGHNATSVGGQAPTIVSSGIGGLQSLSFSGGQRLTVAGQVISSQQFTIMALVTDTSTSTGFREIFSNWNGSSGNTFSSVFLGTVGQNPDRVRFTDALGGGSDNGSGRGSISDPSSPFILGGVSGAGNASIYEDNSLLYSTGALPGRNLSGPYYIGDQGNLNGEFWSGNISALLVWNVALTQAEYLQQVAQLQAEFFAPPEVTVPAPGALALLGFGLLGLVAARRRQAAN